MILCATAWPNAKAAESGFNLYPMGSLAFGAGTTSTARVVLLGLIPCFVIRWIVGHLARWWQGRRGHREMPS